MANSCFSLSREVFDFMGKIVIFLSCIILLGGGCENPIVLKKDLVAFEDRLNKSESTKLLDLDERCSENAQKFIITKKYESENTVFVNHWNRKLSKCFIEIGTLESTENGFVVTRDLKDVLEGKPYASFFQIKNKNTIPICSLYKNGPDESAISCEKMYEYLNFIKPYMNE